MSKIDKLIADLCRDGVDHRPLGQLGTFARGNGLQKKDLIDEGFGAIHYGQVFTFYGTSATTTKSFVAKDAAGRLRTAKPGNLVIATTSENDEDVCKAVAWIGEEEIAISGDAYVYAHTLDPLYVAYYFQTNAFKSQKSRFITGTKVKRVSGADLARIRIPAPPLAIQREIVNTLKTFEALEATLEATLEVEHNLRRSQYAHYRESLLSFADSADVAWRPMGEIGTFTRGRRFTKADMVEEGLEAIHYGEIYTAYGVSTTDTVSHVRTDMADQLRYAKTSDVVIAGVGETVEDVGKAVAWLGDGDVAIHDDTFGFRHEMNPKFVSYFMQTPSFHLQKEKHVSRGKLKRLSREGLGKITMPTPPREEQDRIVAILDGFDALVNDISIGLPAEIKARRQQYEYYRDRLLTFPEKVEA